MKKIAVVTGGGRGIGRVVCLSLAANGWIVVVAGKSLENITKVAKEAGNESIAIQCDVTDSQSVKNLFSQVKDKFSRVDLLFNNAGISSRYVAMDELGADEWDKVVNTNLNGAFYCTQNAFGLMKSQNPQGGRIINNGSIAAYAPRPNSAPYTATKHAITGLTKSTSLDGRSFNIACGQIDIGNADTELAATQKAGITQANGMKMVEPTINPQHVADAVLHMANLPLDVNVLFMTVMATNMPYIGRG
jgi:NAD(P)-dependent dehydrogenase (short-subunit alcohol dehydrogenase family)